MMENKKKEEETIMSKKTAALEIYKQSKKSYVISLISIFGVLMALGTYSVYKWVGVGIAGLICGILAMMIFKDVKFCNYLNKKYDLGFKEIKVEIDNDKPDVLDK